LIDVLKSSKLDSINSLIFKDFWSTFSSNSWYPSRMDTFRN
jgi:hypothetical protein